MSGKTKIEDSIYQLMKLKGITQKELAARAGVPPQRMNDFLKGRRPMRAALLPRICDALNCEPNELLGWEPGYREVIVTDRDGLVVAAVTGDSVVEHEGYHVSLA